MPSARPRSNKPRPTVVPCSTARIGVGAAHRRDGTVKKPLNCTLLVAALVAGLSNTSDAQTPDRSPSKRMVLVELYTSQGCDMCPEAERQLGALAAKNDRIVPIAFHVDYFNDPWKDPYSGALYSRRQMAYN